MYILVHAHITYKMQFQLPQISSNNLDSQHDLCYYTIASVMIQNIKIWTTSNVI